MEDLNQSDGGESNEKKNRTNKEKLCICYIYIIIIMMIPRIMIIIVILMIIVIIFFQNIFIYTYIIYHYIIHDCTHIICQKRILLFGWLVRFLPSLCFTLSTHMRWELLGAKCCLACLGSLWMLWIWKFQRDDGHLVGSLNIEEDQTLPLFLFSIFQQKSGRRGVFRWMF